MLVNKNPSEQRWVPVVSSNGTPLMPCKPVRARKFVQQGRAVKKWHKGIFYIQLLDREDGVTQTTVVAIDPGSKMEGVTVKATHRTFLNLQLHAKDGKAIKKTLEGRLNARRTRRGRNTPCRKPRWANRSKSDTWLPPSTRARWQYKLNLVKTLMHLYPVTVTVIEDVKAVTKKGKKKWNSNFSPVQAGKNYLYRELEKLGLHLVTKSGMDTYNLRQSLNLYKNPYKLSTTFNTHCVDSWVLANDYVGGHVQPDHTEVLVLEPLSYSRRQLHRFNPSRHGNRSRYGGTMSLGYKKGTLVTHPLYGKCLVGGNDGSRLSLHSSLTNKRLCQNAKLEDITQISYRPWLLTGHYNQPPSIKKEQRAQRVITAQTRYQLQGGNYAL